MNQREKIKELLTRGVEEVIDRPHLERSLRSGKKLRVKLGIDPTSPNIHIGRAVLLLKLRAFQDLGHKAVFIVGDFTALVGDTSDKDSERPMLIEAQVKVNMVNYFQQAYKILDKKKTEVHFNSEWLKKLGFIEIANMAKLFGLHEFESREIISKRMKVGKRVSFHELMYPLMQGYDSVAVKADVELGGTDQKFNLLSGRKVQKAYGQSPQDIMTMQILEGTDGRKMSSSWGNVINITDSPENVFGKVMSIPDSLIEKYFLLATRLPQPEIQGIIKKNSPRDQKIILAEEITKQYHGANTARLAKNRFIHQVVKKELPINIPSKKIKNGNYKLSELLSLTGLVSSKSAARRVIAQRGVKVNNVVVDKDVSIEKASRGILLRVGKRKFLKIM